MKVKMSLSMQVMLEETRRSKDGTYPIVIRLRVANKRKTCYLGIKIRPEFFDQKTGCVKARHPHATVINSNIIASRKKLYAQWENVNLQLGHAGKEMAACYLNGFTLKPGNHES